jgi:NADH-quinone oxidoreductase subunit J
MGTFFVVHFWIFSALAIGSALAMITRRSPVAAALWLVNVMFALAALYVMLGAHFLGAAQVLVYAGAIMVVFVFVVMLLNLGENDVVERRSMIGAAAAAFTGGVLAAELLYVIRSQPARLDAIGPSDSSGDAMTTLSNSLFTDNLVAFEVTSILLLVAVVGAVVLAKRGKRGAEVPT